MLPHEKEEAIKAYDTDDNGYLTAGELKDLFLSVASEDEKDEVDDVVKMFINMGSAHGDKKLKVEEAIKLFLSEEEEDPKVEMKTIFRMCDEDGNGVVSTKELTAFVTELFEGSVEEVREVMELRKKYDEDRDGVLSYEEFCGLIDHE